MASLPKLPLRVGRGGGFYFGQWGETVSDVSQMLHTLVGQCDFTTRGSVAQSAPCGPGVGTSGSDEFESQCRFGQSWSDRPKRILLSSAVLEFFLLARSFLDCS